MKEFFTSSVAATVKAGLALPQWIVWILIFIIISGIIIWIRGWSADAYDEKYK